MLIIKNGKIIDPIEDAVYPADLYVKDGVIARIVRRSENSLDENCSCGEKKNGCTDVEEESGSEVLDAKGMLIAPGLADTHVHFRDPGFTYKEDILSGAEAAKKGGYTQIVVLDTLGRVLNELTRDRGGEAGHRPERRPVLPAEPAADE